MYMYPHFGQNNVCERKRRQMLARKPRDLPGFFGHETITNGLAMSKNGPMQIFSG
jgi:hypothetical protein